MDLTPDGRSSMVLLDGEDISGLLRGVVVRSSVDAATTVELQPSAGRRAELIARLPEAQIGIDAEPSQAIGVAFTGDQAITVPRALEAIAQFKAEAREFAETMRIMGWRVRVAVSVEPA